MKKYNKGNGGTKKATFTSIIANMDVKKEDVINPIRFIIKLGEESEEIKEDIISAICSKLDYSTIRGLTEYTTKTESEICNKFTEIFVTPIKEQIKKTLCMIYEIISVQGYLPEIISTKEYGFLRYFVDNRENHDILISIRDERDDIMSAIINIKRYYDNLFIVDDAHITKKRVENALRMNAFFLVDPNLNPEERKYLTNLRNTIKDGNEETMLAISKIEHYYIQHGQPLSYQFPPQLYDENNGYIEYYNRFLRDDIPVTEERVENALQEINELLSEQCLDKKAKEYLIGLKTIIETKGEKTVSIFSKGDISKEEITVLAISKALSYCSECRQLLPKPLISLPFSQPIYNRIANANRNDGFNEFEEEEQLEENNFIFQPPPPPQEFHQPSVFYQPPPPPQPIHARIANANRDGRFNQPKERKK